MTKCKDIYTYMSYISNIYGLKTKHMQHCIMQTTLYNYIVEWTDELENTGHASVYLFLSSLILVIAIYFHHVGTSTSEIIHHLGAKKSCSENPLKPSSQISQQPICRLSDAWCLRVAPASSLSTYLKVTTPEIIAVWIFNREVNDWWILEKRKNVFEIWNPQLNNV